MGMILELFYGLIFQPKPTLERIVREQPLGAAVLTYVLINGTGALMTMVFLEPAELMGQPELLPQVAARLMPKLISYGFVISLFLAVLVLFVLGGFLHLAAELLGGKGSVLSLVSVLGFAALPRIFNLPVALVFGLLQLPLGWLIGFALWVWTVVLSVSGVKQAYGLTTGKSVLVVLTPLIALAAFFIFAIVFFILTVGISFFKLLPSFGSFTAV